MKRMHRTLVLSLVAAVVAATVGGCKQYGGPIPPDPSPKGVKPVESVPPAAPQQTPATR